MLHSYRRFPRHLATAAMALGLLAVPAAAAPRVVASIVPAHSIVAAVMGETGTPELLLSGSMGEHRATYTPGQISLLGQADLVFIIGHGLEAKLSRMSGSEAVNGKRFVELSEAEGVRTLPIRAGGAWVGHDHEHEEADDADGHAEADHADDDGHEHEHDGVLRFDPHVWLDPGNAKAMARAVAAELGRVDPANGTAYAANADRFVREIDATAAEIEATLAPVRQIPFVVFHDAYQYFEQRFGLTAAGSISDISARGTTPSRLKEVRAAIKTSGAVCVFREPQYDDRMVNSAIEGTSARAGELDPLGAGLMPGPGAYRALLVTLAQGFARCLRG